MGSVFRLALSGTPGTGKTTVASLLERNGYNIIRIIIELNISFS